MAGLEPPHRSLDIGIVDVVADRVGIEIARDGKTVAQIDDARMPHAKVQFVDLGHLRPAAARDDAVVGLHGLFGEVGGLRRQRRRGGLGHADGARGLVEALTELAVLTVAHQRIERRVGGRSPRRCADGRESRHPGRAAQEPAPIRISPEPLVRIIHGNVIRSTGPPKPAGTLCRPQAPKTITAARWNQRCKVPQPAAHISLWVEPWAVL